MDDDHSSENPASTAEATEEATRTVSRWRDWLRGLRSGRGDAALSSSVEELMNGDDRRGEDPGRYEARALIRKVLRVSDLAVRDVMVPRADIVAVEIGTSRDELIRLMADQAHSRLPVYRGTLDDVLGMVHIKDVLASIARKETFDLARIIRKVLFVAPSMRVLDLLLQMRVDRTHMALVVDEYGGIDGLTTIEDLVEQIVGEIEDEHDVDEGPRLVARPDGTLVADGRVTVREFEDHVGPVLTAEERADDIDTLGGLVFSLIGRVPTRVEVIRHRPSGIEFEILDADARRIRRLRVCNLPPARDGADG